MKILLDECIPRKLCREFAEHDVKTVPEMGWAAYTNGRLLELAAQQFDVFLTVDRNLSFQQALPKFNVAVIVVASRSNRLKDILPFVPWIRAALLTAKKGEACFIP